MRKKIANNRISLVISFAFVAWSVRQWANVFEFLIIDICVSIFMYLQRRISG